MRTTHSFKNNRFSHIEGDDHCTVDGENRESVGGDCSQNIGGTVHQKSSLGTFSEAGTEVHHKAGAKVVLEAGAEITISAGGSLLKLDPSGVTLAGPGVKINSGGSPGSGSGQSVVLAEMPQVIEGDRPREPGQETLAEVGQRKNAPAINVESQFAALRNGSATCPVCEEQNS